MKCAARHEGSCKRQGRRAEKVRRRDDWRRLMDNSKDAEGDRSVRFFLFSRWGKRKKQKKRGGRVWPHQQGVACEDWGKVRDMIGVGRFDEASAGYERACERGLESNEGDKRGPPEEGASQGRSNTVSMATNGS